MNRVRPAEKSDNMALYELCCKVELARPDDNSTVSQISKRGFLISSYSKHEGVMREYIAGLHDQRGIVSLVSQSDDKVIGWLLAYSKDTWIQEGGWSSGPGNVRWSDRIAASAANDDYFVLEKVVVDPKYQHSGKGAGLFAEFASRVIANDANNVFAEIVEDVLEGTSAATAKPLGIGNKAGMEFSRRMGFERVGGSKEPYNYGGSILGKRGYFMDGIYLIRLR